MEGYEVKPVEDVISTADVFVTTPANKKRHHHRSHVENEG